MELIRSAAMDIPGSARVLACNFRRPAGKTVFGEMRGYRRTGENRVRRDGEHYTRGRVCSPEASSGQPFNRLLAKGRRPAEAPIFGKRQRRGFIAKPGAIAPGYRQVEDNQRECAIHFPELLSSVLQRSHQWRSSVSAIPSRLPNHVFSCLRVARAPQQYRRRRNAVA